MTEQLSRRCTLVIFAALCFALLAGLLAWGPIGVDTPARRSGDEHGGFGVSHAVEMLAALSLAGAGTWGWLTTRASRWPDELRHAWMSFHACVAGAGLLAGIEQLAPHDTVCLLVQTFSAAAFALLTAGMLAERVHPAFGSGRALAAAGLLALGAGALVAAGVAEGRGIDLRPVLLLQALPTLLIPAGATSLRGGSTRRSDWLLLLVACAAAKAFDLADAAILATTGWLSGHALMQLMLALGAGWLGYCATAAAAPDTSAEPTQRQTSLNTAG